MRRDAIWSAEYGAYTAPPLEPKKELDASIANCIIIINCFGYFELYSNKKFIKRITYDQFVKYKNIAKGVYEELSERNYIPVEVTK